MRSTKTKLHYRRVFDTAMKQGIILRFFLACILAAASLIADYSINLKPWRSTEIAVMFFFAASAWGYFAIKLGKRRRDAIIFISFSLLLTLTVTIPLHRYLGNYLRNMPDPGRFFEPQSDISSHEAKSSQIFQSNDTRHLLSYFKQRPTVPVDSIPVLAMPLQRVQSNEIADAERILSSQYAFLSWPAAKLPRDLSWDENPYSDRSWNWFLHTMQYLRPLISAYQTTGELKYLQRAEELVFDWISDNSKYLISPPSVFSWDDQATALRAVNLLVFFELYAKSTLATEDKLETLLSSIIGHARKLSHPEFYTRIHNHGIDQDIALITIAAVFPELKESKKWLSLGAMRLREQVIQTVSPNGVHLEHSPVYHLSTLYHLFEIYQFAKASGMQGVSGHEFYELLKKMANFVAYITKPDGYLVTLGDTLPNEKALEGILLSEFAASDPELRYALTQGASGQPPMALKVYPEEGYVFARRDVSNNPKDALYFVFNAASHKGVDHKHDDDLAFTLSICGKDVLVDPGRYSYNYDTARLYVLSRSAHNTVSVANKTSRSDFSTRSLGVAKLTPVTDTKDYKVLSGISNLTKDLVHQRRIILLNNEVFLIDQIVSCRAASEFHLGQQTHFLQHFHLAPGFSVDMTGAGVEARSKETGLEIVQFHDGQTTAKIVNGSREPYQGWISTRHAVMEPAPVVEFSSTGQEALFLTLLKIVPSCAPSGQGSGGLQFDSVDVSQNSIRVRLRKKGGIQSLSFPKDVT